MPAASINLSDADTASVPGLYSPYLPPTLASGLPGTIVPVPPYTSPSPSVVAQATLTFPGIAALFDESGSTSGSFANASTKDTLHDSQLLHANDPNPVRLYARTGDISDVQLFAGKFTDVLAGRDIQDIALYLQNNTPMMSVLSPRAAI